MSRFARWVLGKNDVLGMVERNVFHRVFLNDIKRKRYVFYIHVRQYLNIDYLS